ncbi:MAG TPA: hypothetical protein VGR69_00905 [Candidatus Rubrimentiphilum sp.]|nr:hypothetical protein [Candidatus Rubrimentiphilum sp.]
MEKKSHTIDRGSLLKGGATAALTALLAGAVEGRADACCDPIDLSYGDTTTLGTISKMAYRAPVRRRTLGTTEFSAVRIWAQGAPGHQQILPPDSSWKLLFSVSSGNAAVKGFDEDQRSHGNGAGAKNLAAEIRVYIK